MILIVIAGDASYRLTVADSLVPKGFPEYAAVEIGESIDAASTDKNQQFILASLLALGIITEDFFLGEDVHAFAFIGAVAVVLHHGLGHFHVVQPGFYRRHFFQAGGVEHGAQKGVEHACRAAAENDVFRRYMRALLLAQVGGQLFARPGVAAVGHVAKGERFTRMLGKGGQALGHSGRSGQVGIAEAEVAHGVVAVFLAQFDAGLKHAPDPRCIFQIPRNTVCKNGHILLPLVVVFDLTIGYASKSRIKQLSFGGPDAF